MNNGKDKFFVQGVVAVRGIKEEYGANKQIGEFTADLIFVSKGTRSNPALKIGIVPQHLEIT